MLIESANYIITKGTKYDDETMTGHKLHTVQNIYCGTLLEVRGRKIH